MKFPMSKNKQFGAISTKVIAMISVCLMIILFFLSFVSIGNQGAKQEAMIEGTYNNNEQILSSCTLSVRNISKIPEKYRKDFESLIKSEMQGRYGDNSVDRVAVFVQERSLNFSPEMYTKIQNEIMSCETNFSLAQKKLIGQKTDYEYMLNSFNTGFFLKMNGYPKKDLTKFKVAVDSEVAEDFKSGVRRDYNTDGKN